MAKQRLELTWYNKDKALIPTETGKYGYTWVDPSDPRYCETHTLVMDEYVAGVQSPKSDEFEYSERADLEPQTDNLMILGESGDVLEALTRVPELAEKYVGKVKLVYIDPPFNTGEFFRSYEDNLENSVWLAMMRDRLLHLRKLLSDDGSIWVHLDLTQNHRMRLLLDEVFGTGNFLTEVVWQKSDSPRRGNGFSVDQDVILVYRKSSAHTPNLMPRTERDNARFSNPDNDPNGPWWDDNPSGNHGDGKGGMCYAIQNPLTGEMMRPPRGASWRYAQERIFRALNQWVPYRYENLHDADWRAANEGVPREKASDEVCAIVLNVPLEKARTLVEQRRSSKEPLPEILIRSTGGIGRKAYVPQTGTNPRTWWSNDQVGHNRAAKSEIKALFPGKTPFSTPKPERLLERIIHVATEPGDLVLDVFAGSGTTAAVAQKMGRRWVCCELLEDTFTTFTLPRLEKVIRDDDPNGVTFMKDRALKADAYLPDGFTIAQLDEAAKLLNALGKLDGVPEDRRTALRDVGSLIATKPSNVRNWRGGGGFQVAHLSPTCFDVDEELGQVVLTEAATRDVLVESVAANLGFYLLHPDDDTVFEGRRGRTLLKVYEGVVDTESAASWLSELEDGETLLIAALGAADGVIRELRRFGHGCRAIVIPEDLFTFNAGEED
ncbi:site-specific DNA-methyltransferase [Xylanimonas cellulosilytica]|uniref:site-specific DNA-methyltransferase n=1 Tax=Xylanimonas cellulosilytica TaxID=186189 RepID=UPI00065FD29E|nr:site-specific DNA-methyltransferase [Xylanimonas cellulosilytica]